MKSSASQLRVGMPGVVLTWCLAASCFATACGRNLVVRQVPAPGAAQAQQHVALTIQKLEQEATFAVTQQTNLLAAIVARKQQEAQAAIEREIPLAVANDTAELSKDVAQQDKHLNAALKKSTDEAQEALEELKEKTETAVNMSAVRTVRDVEKEAELGAMYISNHSAQSVLEADALTKEAAGAAKFSQEAYQNSELWVKELPVKDAAQAMHEATRSQQESVKLRHEYEDIKRMGKLAGNLALNTIKLAKQAVAQTQKAQEEATLTLEQAGQNALLLNTIRASAQKSYDTASWTIMHQVT